jgi:uncharacterized membrane protein
MSKRIVFVLSFFILLSARLYAQTEVEMADAMRANGKIFVVVGIILIVLAGLIAYLFLMDRKVKRLEHRLNERKHEAK